MLVVGDLPKNLLRETNGENDSTYSYYDQDGRVTNHWDGNGDPNLYRYDSAGNRTAVTDAEQKYDEVQVRRPRPGRDRDDHGTGQRRRLEANIQPTNQASIALVRASGFRQEGFSPKYLRIAGDWRDHERWALLAEEFQSPRNS